MNNKLSTKKQPVNWVETNQADGGWWVEIGDFGGTGTSICVARGATESAAINKAVRRLRRLADDCLMDRVRR